MFIVIIAIESDCHFVNVIFHMFGRIDAVAAKARVTPEANVALRKVKIASPSKRFPSVHLDVRLHRARTHPHVYDKRFISIHLLFFHVSSGHLANDRCGSATKRDPSIRTRNVEEIPYK